MLGGVLAGQLIFCTRNSYHTRDGPVHQPNKDPEEGKEQQAMEKQSGSPLIILICKTPDRDLSI